MKFRIYAIFLITASILIGLLAVVISNNKSLKKSLEYSKKNELAYIAENDSLKNKSIQFSYTISELNHSNDSLVKEMVSLKRDLKIKDKQLASLAYLQSMANIKDTVRLIDTVFVEGTKIDTTVRNKWYTIGLHLEYPHMVGLNIKVPSEKYIVSSYKKVLLNPSDCKVRNWFKKRSKIVEVEVVEKNPFIINKKQKFIEVIK